MLTRDLIRKTIAKTEFAPFLANSNLADAVELVKFTPLPLSLEELSKLWSVYFQTPYSLSVAYQGTVVLIESEDSTHAALPVRARNIYVVPFRQPLIEEVRSKDGADQFIFSDVDNRHFGRASARRCDSGNELAVLMLTPEIANVSDTEISLTLPAGLRAGVQGLQVVQLTNDGYTTCSASRRRVKSGGLRAPSDNKPDN